VPFFTNISISKKNEMDCKLVTDPLVGWLAVFSFSNKLLLLNRRAIKYKSVKQIKIRAFPFLDQASWKVKSRLYS
jgi:hypothetical protein